MLVWPQEFDGLDAWVTGAHARVHLTHERIHRPAEWVVSGSLEDLKHRWPLARVEGDRLILDVGVVMAAPESIAATLASRGVPLDAIGLSRSGERCDPLGGEATLRERKLTFVETLRGADDAVLPLDVLALASETGLAPSEELLATLEARSGNLLRACRHRVRRALTRLLVGRYPSEALDILEQVRGLAMVLPEVQSMVGLHKSSRYHHKDVWDHTRQVVRQAIPEAGLRWAALLHDIGKPFTRSFEPPRTVHFFRHDELGAVMFEGIAVRLRFEDPEAARIGRLIGAHLRANLYARTWTDAAVRRFHQELGDTFEDLMHLSRADVTSKRPGRRREAIHNLYDLRCRVSQIKVADALRKPCIPKGLGAAISAALGIAPGPVIGDLRRLCEEAVRDGRLPADPTVEACVSFLRSIEAA